jgi:hypothetical protein
MGILWMSDMPQNVTKAEGHIHIIWIILYTYIGIINCCILIMDGIYTHTISQTHQRYCMNNKFTSRQIYWWLLSCMQSNIVHNNDRKNVQQTCFWLKIIIMVSKILTRVIINYSDKWYAIIIPDMFVVELSMITKIHLLHMQYHHWWWLPFTLIFCACSINN